MTFHGPSCSCCQCRPTPDELLLAKRSDRFDKKPDGAARDCAPQIEKNVLGPHSRLDGPATSEGSRRGGHLGTGSDSVKEAARSIASGARTAGVNWGELSRRR